MSTELYIGTSGYSYSEWKGKFYPADLPANRRLGYYAQRFNTVEINNTFYRMPAPKMLATWAAQVPADFRFAFKAPASITHHARLLSLNDAAKHFVEVTQTLGERAGPLLFQLPPAFRRDDQRLAAFLQTLPAHTAAAFEFRHSSWHDPAVYDTLRRHHAALCITDTDDNGASPLEATADWGYLRLRRIFYSDEDLTAWLTRLRALGWRRAYIYFKHEDEARGPQYAARLRELAGE